MHSDWCLVLAVVLCMPGGLTAEGAFRDSLSQTTGSEGEKATDKRVFSMQKDGEEPSYTQHHWTTEDGLPVNSVRDIAEGPQGYLWLATYDGLVRFDGVEFAEMSGGNSALPTSQIAKVHHGPEGRILARTETGTVARIDPERPAVT